jgi:hypothetical protein
VKKKEVMLKKILPKAVETTVAAAAVTPKVTLVKAVKAKDKPQPLGKTSRKSADSTTPSPTGD